ncbi:MAG: hypothetical protein HFG70_02800 [Hungatella sp.]|nr:hypothetical protein [Hungatella sp.]
MAKKTNKTSHVMDLLTNGASPEAEASESAAEAVSSGQEKKSDVQSHTVTPAKVTVVDEGSMNDRVSQEILGKLTEELEEETKQEQPAGGPEAVSEHDDTPAVQEMAQDMAGEAPESPAAGSEPVSEESKGSAVNDEVQASSDVQEPAADTAETPAPEASEPVAAQEPVKEEEPAAPKTPEKPPHPIIPESHFGSHTKNREYRFVNVMEQLLMRQDLDAVLRQHNVCTCPRCMSDVCALALTGLPSKYVVTSKDSISPLLSYYENKYKIPVLTELMKACNKVRENPRHKKV